MKLLDLFCCAGGAGRGYHDAGFEVTGVDIKDQPRYPYEFIQGDALDYARNHGHEYDAIHASPPCQAYSATKSFHENQHPDLVAETREVLNGIGKPWVMENVVGAPLEDPMKLDGRHFGITAPDVDGVMLKLVRPRLFESNFELRAPDSWYPNSDLHTASVYGAGGGWTPRRRDDPERRGGYIPHTDVVKRLLGIDWMTKHELSQSVPPVFAQWVGEQLAQEVQRWSSR